MPTNVRKNATFTTMINNVVTDLMLKTTSAQVEVAEGVSLADKLTELTTAISNKAGSEHTHLTSDVTGLDDALTARPTKDAMNTAISTAISELINGAPETYDTLKEIADYIETHEEVATALNEAIGKKADATTVETLQTLVNSIKTTVDGLGALASKDKVATADLDETLAAEVAKITDKAEASDVADLQGKVSALTTKTEHLGALASKDAVAESDLDETLGAKITDLNSKAHKHRNAVVLNSFTNAKMGVSYATDDREYQKMANVCIGLAFNADSPVGNVVFDNVKKSIKNGTELTYSAIGNKDFRDGGGFVATAAMVYSLSKDVDSKVTALETSSAKTYYSATQPEGLKNGDTWFKLDK